MTDNFIAFFYRERLLVAVVSLLITAGGILALSRLNVDAFPDVTPVQVEIDTEGQGLAPQEVEQLITFPIENVMNGIPGVVRVQSISKFGLSVVTVYFRDDVVNYKITLKSLFEAIQNNNQNSGATFIEHGDEQYVVRGLGLVKDIEDIQNIVLDSRGGTPIRVSDVAQVQVGNELRQGAVTKDGQGEVVTGIVLKRINENTKQVIE